MSWPMVKLGDLVSIKGGGTPSKSDSSYWDGDIPWASVKDLKSSRISETEDNISALGVKNSATNIIPAGTIVTATRMALGKFAINTIDMAINQDLKALFVRDINELSRDYLFRFLESKSQYIQGEGKGATVKGITLDFLKSIDVPLPPLAEQKRIAAILDKADAIRRKRQQAIQLADDFLRAVFLEMFGDPVTNPKGWEVRPMQELIKIQGGYAFKSEDFSENGTPVVKIGNANKVGFTTKGISFIRPDNPNKLKQYEIYEGDLLMSLTGTVGKDDYANITEVTDEYDMYYLNQRVAKISVINGQITKNFIKHYLAHPKIKSEITKNNRGVRQANIGNADIYELSVPVPSNSMLEKFDMLVEQASLLITKIDSAPAQIDSFFNALSQKAFSGAL